MKNKVYKHICAVSTVVMAALMFTNWFTIDLMVGVERHSFLTIPDLINAAVDFLSDIAGNTATFVVLLLAGILEYLCLIAAALGIWGVIRTYMKNRKSRLVFVSQCTALCLSIIGIIAIIIIDIVSSSALGGIISIYPTIWFLLAIVFLILSLVSGYMYSKVLVDKTADL